jgi:hypothetical protein
VPCWRQLARSVSCRSKTSGLTAITTPSTTLDHLRDEGLIRVIALGEHERAVLLTAEGRDLLDANRHDRDEGESQTFYAGLNRPRELEHDVHPHAEDEAGLCYRNIAPAMIPTIITAIESSATMRNR